VPPAAAVPPKAEVVTEVFDAQAAHQARERQRGDQDRAVEVSWKIGYDSALGGTAAAGGTWGKGFFAALVMLLIMAAILYFTGVCRLRTHWNTEGWHGRCRSPPGGLGP